MPSSHLGDPLYAHRWYRETTQFGAATGWAILAVVLAFLTLGGIIAYTLAGHLVIVAKPTSITIGQSGRIVSPAAPTAPVEQHTAPAIAIPVDR